MESLVQERARNLNERDPNRAKLIFLLKILLFFTYFRHKIVVIVWHIKIKFS